MTDPKQIPASHWVTMWLTRPLLTWKIWRAKCKLQNLIKR